MRLRTAVAALALALGASAAHADKRVALVIGNAAYVKVGALANPVHDAEAVKSLFRGAGFDVVEVKRDIGAAAMRRALRDFSERVRDADIAVVLYAGHGIEVNGTNYLIPVDAVLERDIDVEDETVPLDRVTQVLEQAKRLRLVILDACRDNPFTRSMRRTIAGRSIGRGLAKVEILTSDMLIAFAAKAGSTAADGAGLNSPYSTALMKHLTTPGLDLRLALGRVRDDVIRSTGSRQEPFVYGSLGGGEIALVPAAQQPQVAPQPQARTAPLQLSEAAEAWDRTRDSGIALLEAFVARYRDTFYAELARARIEELKKQQTAVAAPPATRKCRLRCSTPTQEAAPAPAPPARARADVVKLFAPFALIFERAERDYVEPPDEQKMLAAAIDAIRKSSPVAQQAVVAGAQPSAGSAGGGKLDLEAVYDAALTALNKRAPAADDAKLVQAAIGGMLASLNPHSGYMDQKAFRDMQVQTKGEFGGIGTELTMEGGQPKVVTPIDGTPAQRAGMRANDLITNIDGEPVQGLTLNQAAAKLRGPVNSQVKLALLRDGEPLELTITREIIRVRAVRSRIEGDVGYIRITQFNQQTTEGLNKAIDDIGRALPGDKLKGYVIDLRNNPGGLLDQVVSVADALLEGGEIVSTRGRNSNDNQRFSAKPGDLAKGKPIVVLINGGTAAGSEILAGALQDHKRATIVGTRSFGKGSIQTIIPLGGEQGALRLTTSRNFTPSGHSIQAAGIVPDTEVLQDVPDKVKAPGGEASLPGHLAGQGQEHTGSQSYVPPNPKDDKALRKALELLHGKAQ